MKTSEIFEACIPLIEEKKYEYICHALCEVVSGDAFLDWKDFRISNNPQRLIIEERLGDCSTMVSLCIQLNIGVCEILGLEDDRWIPDDGTLREFRVEWLHSLVEEFKAKGD